MTRDADADDRARAYAAVTGWLMTRTEPNCPSDLGDLVPHIVALLRDERERALELAAHAAESTFHGENRDGYHEYNDNVSDMLRALKGRE
jgi:hypothetical protein